MIAATVYFVALFALGFVLGTIRTLFVVPRLGLLAATAVEVPVMLAAGWLACRWIVRHWQVPPVTRLRWIMALLFLALLLVFEASLAAILFDRSLTDQWASLRTPAGSLGLAAQIIAASMPMWVGMRARQ